ncbi:hypothetical protein GUJ93_ZPchr0015g6946 [Zizania palustris]|uniref:Uncharacterized protein n=1 Tax=Zizania palustris TaxID=103762 RepID=A0A8J5THF5_ZIZPA|nr:hypothetical protein GUJ93_ZPchr0015g6946 [Zizania palustris]
MTFSVGDVGGSTFYFLNGLRNSPNGAHLASGMETARLNVPHLAGSFAIWGVVFSACDFKRLSNCVDGRDFRG